MSVKSEFSRIVYTEALEWYKSAEKKAEILLGLLGGFIVFASSIILANPNDVQAIIAGFSTIIWIGLALTFTTMFYGLYAAYKCLRSRMTPAEKINLQTNEVFYPDDHMYFFQHRASHETKKLSESLCQVNEEKEISIYSSLIIALSRNVVQKHNWINKGFIAFCYSILPMFLTTIVYMIGFIKNNIVKSFYPNKIHHAHHLHLHPKRRFR